MLTSLKRHINNNNNNTSNNIKQTPQQIFTQKKKEMNKYNIIFKRMFNITTKGTSSSNNNNQQDNNNNKEKDNNNNKDEENNDNNIEFEMTPSNLARHPIKAMKALFKKYGWTFINTAIVLYITWCLAAFGIVNMTSPDTFINIAKEYVPPVYNIGLNLFQNYHQIY
eukprot:UN04690